VAVALKQRDEHLGPRHRALGRRRVG
jgi:hypothetical protein